MRHVEIRQQMTALVKRWPGSGVTQDEFAARHGVSRTKLRYWLRRVGADPHTQTPVRFAPVQVIGPMIGDSGALEIVLGTGERVLVRPGTAPELVRMVVRALRETC